MNDNFRDDCLFCSILVGKTPAKVVYEDDHVLAFLDIDPVCEGHTLLIPKKHFDDLLTVELEYLSPIMEATKKITQNLVVKLPAEGFNVVQNNKKAAGQIIYHYHIHLIPRNDNDGVRIINSQATIREDLFSKLDDTLNRIKM